MFSIFKGYHVSIANEPIVLPFQFCLCTFFMTIYFRLNGNTFSAGYNMAFAPKRKKKRKKSKKNGNKFRNVIFSHFSSISFISLLAILYKYLLISLNLKQNVGANFV